MKKLLGILLVLALTVGAFSGLTLFSMSANAATSESFFTPGSELYLDFENENDVTTYTSQVEWADANAVAEAGAPTTLPNGKPVGAVAFYNHPTDNNNHNGFAIPNTYVAPKGDAEGVVNEPGWYVLSAWIYVVARNSGNNGSMNVNMQAGGGTCFIEHISDSGSNTGKNTTWNTIKPTVTGQWFYYETPFYVGQEFYELSKTYGANIRFDTFGKCSAYFVDSVRLTKVEGVVGTDYNVIQMFSHVTGNYNDSAAKLTKIYGSTSYAIKYYNFTTNTIKAWQKLNADAQQKNPMVLGFGNCSVTYTPVNGESDYVRYNPMPYQNLNGKDNCWSLGVADVPYSLHAIDITHLATNMASLDKLFSQTTSPVRLLNNSINWSNIKVSYFETEGKNSYNGSSYGIVKKAMGYVYADPYFDGTVKATASAFAGYKFVGWVDEYGRTISTNATLYTKTDKPVTAKFVDPNAVETAEKNLISDDLSNFENLEIGSNDVLSTLQVGVGGSLSFSVVKDEDAEKGKVLSFTAPSTYQSPVWRLGDTLRELDASLGGGKTMRISFSADVKSSSANDAFKLSVRSTANGQITSANYADINGNKGSYNIPANTWTTVNWVIDITPELLGTAVLDFCFETVIRSATYQNSTVSIDNVVVKYVLTPQYEHVLEVVGDAVEIDGVEQNIIYAAEGQNVTITQTDERKVLTGVKLGETVYLADNGVVTFTMPNSDVTLELITEDVGYETGITENQINVIAGNGTVIKTVTDVNDIPQFPARLGYTKQGVTINGEEHLITELDDIIAEVQKALDNGTKLVTVKYVYTKNASDKTVILVNGEKSIVEKLKLVTFIAPAVDENGDPFAYWEDANGNIVSYNRILAVYPTSNLYVTASYKENFDKKDYFELTGFTRNADQSISLVSNRNMVLPLESHGLRLLVSNKQLDSQAVENALELKGVTEGTTRYTLWAKSTNPVGTFVASKTSADSNSYWYAAAIYKVEGGADYVISNYKELTPNQVESALATFDDVHDVDQLVDLGILSDPTGTSRTYTSSLVEEEPDADGKVNKYFKVTFDAHNSNTWSGPSFGNFKNYFKETGVYTLSFRYKINSLTDTEAGDPGLKFIGASGVCTDVDFDNDETNQYHTDFFDSRNNSASPQIYHNFSGQGLKGTATEDDGWYVASYTFELKYEDLNTFVGTNWKVAFQNISKLAHEICIDDITIVKGENPTF